MTIRLASLAFLVLASPAPAAQSEVSDKNHIVKYEETDVIVRRKPSSVEAEKAKAEAAEKEKSAEGATH